MGTSRRRSILAILLDRATAISEQELALTLVAAEQDISVADVPNEGARNIRLDLRHTHLPLLETCGLVTWEREEETITTTDHSALTDPRFQRLLAIESEGLNDVLSRLANKRRRLLLTILRDDRTSMSRTALARETTQRESGETEPSQALIDDIMVSLLQIHLPTLHNANIIEYDVRTGRVMYTGHPELEELITILHEPDNRLVNKLDGFFGGLLNSYREASKSTRDPFNWPNFWSDSYHG